MSGGLFDYIQKQSSSEPPEMLSEPRRRTPLEIAQVEQQNAVEHAREVYATYQENIKKVGTLRSEIIKGLYQGENIADLLLKALQAISCMTGENLTYQVAKDIITTVYGEVLHQPDSLEVAGAEVQERIAHLENFLQGANGTERERILQAIKAHRAKLDQLSQ